MITNLKICLCGAICIVILLLMLLQYYLMDGTMDNKRENILIWWTPFLGNIEYSRTCGNIRCLFSGNRNLMDHSNFQGFLFYGSNFKPTDLPLPRSSSHLWALFHEESPKNVPMLMYDQALSLFNVTATFSQNSDYPLTLQYLYDYETLISRKYIRTVEDKNQYQQDELLAPVLYMQSICDTMSGRDQYMTELMQYINVDSYGKCLNNKELPGSLSGSKYLNTIDSDELYTFISRYKFIISYENSVCNDYLTEKIWRTLTVGSVPIYFGAPNIKKWLPNEQSAILITDFKSPKELAEFVLNLNENDIEYNKYLMHKSLDPHPVTNNILLRELSLRSYRTTTLIQDFECFVCSSNFDKRFKKGFECKEKLVYPSMEEQHVTEIDWQSLYTQGICESEMLHYFVTKNKPYDEKEYMSELLRRYEQGICKA